MDCVEVLKAFVLGIVEGITEWLPISSTGHLILLDEIIQMRMGASAEEIKNFKEMFDVVIQLGAIMAVILLNWQKLWPFLVEKNKGRKYYRWKKGSLEIWKKVIIASLPAAIIGLIFDDWLDFHFYNPLTVSFTLVIYGIFFIWIENTRKGKRARVNRIEKISYKDAIIIGVYQVLALIPGTSRSGATILGALIIGLARGIAAEFSFYLAVPVMFGASALKVVKFLLEGNTFSLEMGIVLLVGMGSAFIISIVVIQVFLGYVQKHDFRGFGWYRIVLGMIVLKYFGS